MFAMHVLIKSRMIDKGVLEWSTNKAEYFRNSGGYSPSIKWEMLLRCPRGSKRRSSWRLSDKNQFLFISCFSRSCYEKKRNFKIVWFATKVANEKTWYFFANDNSLEKLISQKASMCLNRGVSTRKITAHRMFFVANLVFAHIEFRGKRNCNKRWKNRTTITDDMGMEVWMIELLDYSELFKVNVSWKLQKTYKSISNRFAKATLSIE